MLLFLLLGTIINVAVATLITAQLNHGRGSKSYTDNQYGKFGVSVPHSRGHRAIGVFPGEVRISELRGLSIYSVNRIIDTDRYNELLPGWSQFHDYHEIDEIFAQHGNEHAVMRYNENAAGWPVYSMRSRYLEVMYLVLGPSVADFVPMETLGGPLRIGQFPDEHLVPLRPIWPGFAINTVFYAVIVWLLFAAPLSLRRSRRMKRGLCPKCAYPIGASDTCTECGRPIRRKAETQKT